MIPALCPAMAPVSPTKLIDVLTQLGLLTNLQLCLDAGDSASYSGSGQTWSDLSGGGVDFVRGATSSSESSDPTFNGVAGNQSGNEYFSYDGGDLFTIAGTVPTWVSNLHKDNATFTIIEWIYANGISSNAQIYGEVATGNNSTSGIYLGTPGTGNPLSPELLVFNAGGSTILKVASSLASNNNAWNMVGVSFTESTGALTFAVNGSFDAQTGKTYSSPSTDAAGTFNIGGDVIVPNHENAGDRIAALAIWSRALSQAEITSLFSATRTKFGV